MTITLSRRFESAYKSLPPSVQSRVDRAIRLLAQNPRHPGLGVRLVRGRPRGEQIFEARVNGGRRVTFNWEGDVITLRNVGPHDVVREAP
jgi:mRNA interferase RelE/StbE